MSIKQFGSLNAQITGDGTSTEIDLDIRELSPSNEASLPTSKLSGILAVAISGSGTLPTIASSSFKGNVVTIVFSSPLAQFNLDGSGQYGLQLTLAFDSD